MIQPGLGAIVHLSTEAGLYHPVKRSLKLSRAPIVTSASRPLLPPSASRLNSSRALLAAASLEVGDHRYDAQQIRELYDASAYPLKRHSRRLVSRRPFILC